MYFIWHIQKGGMHPIDSHGNYEPLIWCRGGSNLWAVKPKEIIRPINWCDNDAVCAECASRWIATMPEGVRDGLSK